MNTFVLLPLQRSMAERGADKDDRLRGYMTVLVVNPGIMKFISILTTVVRPMIKYDVDKPWHCFRQDVKCTLAIR